MRSQRQSSSVSRDVVHWPRMTPCLKCFMTVSTWCPKVLGNTHPYVNYGVSIYVSCDARCYVRVQVCWSSYISPTTEFHVLSYYKYLVLKMKKCGAIRIYRVETVDSYRFIVETIDRYRLLKLSKVRSIIIFHPFLVS